MVSGWKTTSKGEGEKGAAATRRGERWEKCLSFLKFRKTKPKGALKDKLKDTTLGKGKWA